jgi:hypothetical protein
MVGKGSDSVWTLDKVILRNTCFGAKNVHDSFAIWKDLSGQIKLIGGSRASRNVFGHVFSSYNGCWQFSGNITGVWKILLLFSFE